MWRALFLALGTSAVILGAEFLVVDKATLKATDAVEISVSSKSAPNREFVPPEWAPWSLISVGAVTILYSFTIPRRANG